VQNQKWQTEQSVTLGNFLCKLLRQNLNMAKFSMQSVFHNNKLSYLPPPQCFEYGAEKQFGHAQAVVDV